MTAAELQAAADIAVEDAERIKGSPLTEGQRDWVLRRAMVRVERADWDAHGRSGTGPVTDEERQARRLFLKAKERAAGVERWVWLSFVNEGVFQGCVMLRAHGTVDAVDRAWLKGINPGGEVRTVEAEPGWDPRVTGYADRLLTKEDVVAFDAAYEAAGESREEAGD
jgi:hypothetical protein